MGGSSLGEKTAIFELILDPKSLAASLICMCKDERCKKGR